MARLLHIAARALCCTGLALTIGCGTNTDEPVFPLITLTAVGAPAISAISPQEGLDGGLNYIIEFDVQYYVSNAEDGFLGYNLYITTSSTSAEAQLVGASTGPYLPNGITPSFVHVGAAANTTDLITQRVTHFKPAPGERRFDLCEKYFFRMTSVVRTGAESVPSPEIGVCAMVDPALCPSDSACN